MTPDRARAAVAAAIVSSIPETSAEMLAGWTEAQWRAFLVAVAAAAPMLWASVERNDAEGLLEASQLGDQVAALAEGSPELLGLPSDPIPVLQGPEEMGLRACPACSECARCGGAGFVPLEPLELEAGAPYPSAE